MLTRLRPYLPLILIAIAAFGWRLAVIEWIRPECTGATIEEARAAFDQGECYLLTGDTEYVTVQARELREGNGFVEAGRVMFTGADTSEPGAAHPPGFTVFLAFWQWLGVDTVGGWRVVMAGVGSVGVGIVGLAGWRLMGSRQASTGDRSLVVGVVAAGLAAVSPLLWERDVDLLVEGLLIPLVALFVVAALRLWRHPGLGNAALVGAVVGVAWLTRSEQVLLLAALLPMLARGMPEVAAGRRIAMAGLAGVVALALMAPWTTYNLTRFEEPVWLSTNGGLALLFGACDDTFYGEAFAYYDWYCVTQVPVDPEADESVHEGQRMDAAVQYLRDHPQRTVVVMAARFGRFWRIYEVGDTTEREAVNEGVGWIAARGGLVALYLGLPFAAAGTWALRRRRVPVAPVLMPIVISTLAAVVLIPLPRFRVPADVSLVILAAVGAVWLWDRWRAPA